MLGIMTKSRIVVAANIRARLAWLSMNAAELGQIMGWSKRTTYNKLHAVTMITADELPAIAEALGTDPGALYSVPATFAEPGVPAAARGLLTWRFDQLNPLTWVFAGFAASVPVSVG